MVKSFVERITLLGTLAVAGAAQVSAQTMPAIEVPEPPAFESPDFGPAEEANWVGPDERIWYFRRAMGSGSLADVKREITEQFRKTKPVLTRSEIMLFEPGGRIWFAAQPTDTIVPQRPSSPVLLGFDGKDWIERQTEFRVDGRPGWPLGGQRNHVFVNGRAFFSIANEIHEFDGSAWRVHVVAAVDPQSRAGVLAYLKPEPDGKGLLVTTLHGRKHGILRWDGSNFVQMRLPDNAFAIQSISPGAQGVWVLTQGTLTLVPYAPDEQPVVQNVRGARLGDYTAANVLQMHSDYVGRTYFLLQGMGKGGGSHENAILLEDRDGQFLPLRHPAAVARCNPSFYVDPEPVVPVAGTNGELVWLPGNRSTVGPLLLDTRRGRVVHECPYIDANRLMGATQSGLLLAGGAPYSTQAKPLPQRAVDRLVDLNGPTAVTTAGHALANMGNRLSILENGQWRPLLAERALDWGYLRGARDAIMVFIYNAPPAENRWRVALVAGGKAVYADSLQQLLQQHQPLLAEHFGNRLLTCEGGNGPRFAMCVNRAGDVFLADEPEYRLRILQGGKWIDPSDDLRAIGMPAVGIQFIAPVGDGSVIYLAGQSSNPMGVSAVRATRKDGKVVFEPAPPALSSPIRDAEGGLWFIKGGALRNNTFEFPGLVRMTDTEVKSHPTLATGELRLLDAHGCVVLMASRNGTTIVCAARDGKLTTRGIPLQGLGLETQRVLEVRPGVLWVATRSAIHEFEEPEPGSGKYTLREAFRPALELWEPESMNMLSDGRIAIRGVQDRLATNDRRLYALPAPRR